MDELKRCPFCGGEAFLFVDDGVCVYCSNCGARTKTLADSIGSHGKPVGNATKRVIDLWNKRWD